MSQVTNPRINDANIYKMNSSKTNLSDIAFVHLTAYKSEKDNARIAYRRWILPLPSSLDHQTQYNWNAAGIGHIVNSVINTSAQSNNLMSKAGKIIDGGMSNMLDNNEKFWDSIFKNSSAGYASEATMRKMIQGSGDMVGVDNLTGYLDRLQNRAYNPNEQIFFEGLSQQEFTLPFNIVPMNKDESDFFSEGYYALLESSAPGYEKNNYYFTYPDYFDVGVYINQFCLIQRHQCVLTNINCNFTPNGDISWGPDNKPTEYNLELSFKETVIQARGNNNGNVIFGKKFN